MDRIRYFTIIAVLLLSSCSRGYEKIGGYAQGGVYSVTYNASRVKVSRDRIQKAVDSVLFAIDTTLSGYNASSQLSRLARGEKFEPSQMLCRMYERARYYYEETDGALDVACGPLFDIWGFGFTTDSLPSARLVAETLSSCGMKRLPATLKEALAGSDTLRLNFNAIAQGFSCDEVASYLESVGVKDMLVDIGEIYCRGHNPSGKDWRIGIDRPVDGNNVPGADLQSTFSVGGEPCGVVTSGNYRKFYVRDGKKYSHTIDPRTGWPVSHSLLSATVIAPTAEQADAYATACMVLGPEKARDFINSKGLRACLVCADTVIVCNWKESN